MGAFFLTCCIRGMEVTRHYTIWQGTQVVMMLASAVAVAGLIVSVALYRVWTSRA